MSRLLLTGLMMLAVSLCAFALTGSGDSASGALETVSPRLDSVSAVTEKSLSAPFSEAMRKPGVTTPGNYGVSGLGAGTPAVHPNGVKGDGPYSLTWSTRRDTGRRERHGDGGGPAGRRGQSDSSRAQQRVVRGHRHRAGLHEPVRESRAVGRARDGACWTGPIPSGAR